MATRTIPLELLETIQVLPQRFDRPALELLIALSRFDEPTCAELATRVLQLVENDEVERSELFELAEFVRAGEVDADRLRSWCRRPSGELRARSKSKHAA